MPRGRRRTVWRLQSCMRISKTSPDFPGLADRLILPREEPLEVFVSRKPAAGH